MTEQDLNALFYLDKQINRLKRRIAELRGDAGGGGLGGMPRGNNISNPTEMVALKRIELLEQLNKVLEEKIEAEISIRAFINNVKDPCVKTIMECRYLYQMSWVDIAAEISPRHKDIDRTTVTKMLRRWLEKNL